MECSPPTGKLGNEKTLHLHENWLLAKQGSLKKHVFPFLFDAYPALLSAASKTGNSMKRCKYCVYIYIIYLQLYIRKMVRLSNPPFPVLKLRALKSPSLMNGGAPVCNSSHSRYINIKAKRLPCKTFTQQRATANAPLNPARR